MKIKIVVMLVTTNIFHVSLSVADENNLKKFTAGEPAVAKDINENFVKLSRAIENNLKRIKVKTHKEEIDEGTNNIHPYGDGTAGELIEGDWITSPQLNTNFSSCSISNYLRVPSGTTIRCQSGFTLDTDAVLDVSYGFGAGVATSQPVEYTGGLGLYPTTAASSFTSFPMGGAGDNGGGYIRIIANGDIIINGTILAHGHSGNRLTRDGGGAGGIVVLQSSTAIDTTLGMVQVNGGDGAYYFYTFNTKYVTQQKVNPNSLVIGFPQIPISNGAGGGGGGIVVLNAPLITSPESSINNNGGQAGSTATQNSSSGTKNLPSYGGRASGGNGGAQAEPGEKGYTIKLEQHIQN